MNCEKEWALGHSEICCPGGLQITAIRDREQHCELCQSSEVEGSIFASRVPPGQRAELSWPARWRVPRKQQTLVQISEDQNPPDGSLPPGVLQRRMASLEAQQSSSRKPVFHPTPGLLPGGVHGQSSPVGYSPRGRQESDTPEPLELSASHAKYPLLPTDTKQWLTINEQMTEEARSWITEKFQTIQVNTLSSKMTSRTPHLLASVEF